MQARQDRLLSLLRKCLLAWEAYATSARVVRAGAPSRTASQDPGAASPQDALPAEGEGGEGTAPAPRTDVDDALVGKVSKVLSALGPRARRDTRLAGRRGSILEEASAGL